MLRVRVPNAPQIFELTGYRAPTRCTRARVRNLERAVELDPRNFYTLQQLALSYKILRRYVQEIATEERALSIRPDDAETRAATCLASFDWKADTRPLHQTIDEIRANNPEATKSIAMCVLVCFGGTYAAAADMALTALGDATFGDDASQFSAALAAGCWPRMTKDEARRCVRGSPSRAGEESGRTWIMDQLFVFWR
jgi:hypothetical protein